MPDELNQVLSGDQTEPTPPSQTTTEEFDPERAKALIAKLRGEEKRAKQLEKELATYKQSKEDSERAEMTEIERLRIDLQKANDARQRLEADFETQRRNNAVITAASQAGMYDPNDAIAHLANVGTDDIASALETLKAAKPYLFKSTTNNSPTFSPTNPSGGAAKPSDQQVLAEIYGSRRSNLFAGGGVFGPNNSE